jgi:hypothetical protein
MHGWLEEEARVDEAMCFGAGDEAAQWFLGRQKSERERESGDIKLLRVVRESAGPEILVRGT